MKRRFPAKKKVNLLSKLDAVFQQEKCPWYVSEPWKSPNGTRPINLVKAIQTTIAWRKNTDPSLLNMHDSVVHARFMLSELLNISVTQSGPFVNSILEYTFDETKQTKLRNSYAFQMKKVAYTGTNQFLLSQDWSSCYWATFKQVSSVDGSVSGEKSKQQVMFFTRDGECKTCHSPKADCTCENRWHPPTVRWHPVFSGAQITGIERILKCLELQWHELRPFSFHRDPLHHARTLLKCEPTFDNVRKLIDQTEMSYIVEFFIPMIKEITFGFLCSLLCIPVTITASEHKHLYTKLQQYCVNLKEKEVIKHITLCISQAQMFADGIYGKLCAANE